MAVDLMRQMKEIVGTVEPDNKVTAFVPQVDGMPPVVERFISTMDNQFNKTYDGLLNSATLLENKARELRRRAEQILRDRADLETHIKDSVRFEEECRHVAQSLSMIPVQNTE